MLDELQNAGVKLLVDVRAVAASRRPGFSKTQLAAGLDERGIGYVHLRDLGTPKEGRDAARGGDFRRLKWIYDKQLATPQAREQLDELSALVRKPDGTTITARAFKEWLLRRTTNPKEGEAFLLSGLAKGDVPIGSEMVLSVA